MADGDDDVGDGHRGCDPMLRLEPEAGQQEQAEDEEEQWHEGDDPDWRGVDRQAQQGPTTRRLTRKDPRATLSNEASPPAEFLWGGACYRSGAEDGSLG
jgi:hypothetical protein